MCDSQKDDRHIWEWHPSALSVGGIKNIIDILGAAEPALGRAKE